MLRLGLSASKISESVPTTSIGLFLPLIACLTLGRLPLADSITWLSVARRACTCGASGRSAAAVVAFASPLVLASSPALAGALQLLVVLFLAPSQSFLVACGPLLPVLELPSQPFSP